MSLPTREIPEHDRGDDEDPERDEAPDREDLQDRLVEPEADGVVVVDHALRMTQDVGDPEDDQIAAEGHGHGVQAESRDQAALGQADDARRAERGDDADQRRAAARQHRNHAAEQVDGRDGEVELARDHRDPERERNEAVRGEVLEDVVDVGGAHGVPREERHQRQREDHAGEDRVGRDLGGTGAATPRLDRAHRPRCLRLVSTTTTTTMMPRTRICTPVE